jgi:hypothetical protein
MPSASSNSAGPANALKIATDTQVRKTPKRAMTTLFPQGTHGASRIVYAKEASLDHFVGGRMFGSSAWIGRKQTEQGDNKGLRAARTVFAFPKKERNVAHSLTLHRPLSRVLLQGADGRDV